MSDDLADERTDHVRGDVRWPVSVYLASRALILLVAALEGYVRHKSVLGELSNWDGKWYVKLATGGYPDYASHLHTTLGFFPLYPLVIWLVAKVLLGLGITYYFTSLVAFVGVVISGLGGLVAAILVYRLAVGWWGEPAGRRAVAFFCLFPGSVVFSMVYPEGLTISLAAGTILALERKRWLLAGILAGIATSTEPEALVLVVVCAVSAVTEVRGCGWHSRRARRSLLAPALSLTGVAAVAGFLWAWTGTPFATLIAQHDAWHERTDPLALWHLLQTMASRILHYSPYNSVYNPAAAVAGAYLLFVLLLLLYRQRDRVSREALVWTLGISLIAVTSERLPPNSRMLITAFPVLLVVGVYVQGRRFTLLQCINGALLVTASWLTFISHLLPP